MLSKEKRDAGLRLARWKTRAHLGSRVCGDDILRFQTHFGPHFYRRPSTGIYAHGPPA